MRRGLVLAAIVLLLPLASEKKNHSLKSLLACSLLGSGTEDKVGARERERENKERECMSAVSRVSRVAFSETWANFGRAMDRKVGKWVLTRRATWPYVPRLRKPQLPSPPPSEPSMPPERAERIDSDAFNAGG